ncbi:GOLPH3/VPS74 family protein [Ancylomarina sp. YFZ004]
MNLSSVEKFFVLAHHPQKGKFMISDIHINYGLIGAILLDMSLEDRIKVEDDRLVLKGSIEFNDLIRSEIALQISQSEKPRKIRYWMSKLARKSRKYKWTVLNDLSDKRIVRIEEKRFLGLIPYKKTYLQDNVKRDSLIEELRRDVFTHRKLNKENVVILSLIEACKMHKILASDKSELRVLRKELKDLLIDSPIADVLDKTIKQVQAAIMGAVIASTVASSAGSN